MNLNALLKRFGGNAETALFGTAMHYFQVGRVNVNHLDAEAIVLSLTAALSQVEHDHPGIAEKYGWCQMSDMAALARSIGGAGQATAPDGLR